MATDKDCRRWVFEMFHAPAGTNQATSFPKRVQGTRTEKRWHNKVFHDRLPDPHSSRSGFASDASRPSRPAAGSPVKGERP